MSDFDALQRAIQTSAQARWAEAQQCEAVLTSLYQALRQASGPGLPLNNVAMELCPDPSLRLRPPPLGSYHAAWLRLGLCEVQVRLRREGPGFAGNYGHDTPFHLPISADTEMLALARELLRTLTRLYSEMSLEKWTN